MPAELRSLVISNRDDLPFVQGIVTSWFGAAGDYLLADPANEQTEIRWIPVGTNVTLLEEGTGSDGYGSRVWYLVALPDPNGTNQLLKGWLPKEVLGPQTSASENQAPIQSATSGVMLVEDFENINLAEFIINQPALREGNLANLYRVKQPYVNSGEWALAFDFEITTDAPSYIGFGKTSVTDQNWSEYSELCFWIKTENLLVSDAFGLEIQIGVSDNAVAHYGIPNAYHLALGSDTHCVAFSDERWTTPGNMGDLTKLRHFAIYASGSVNDKGTIYVDNIFLR